jgi:regulatory protein
MQKPLTISEITTKMEHFCAYQERCHSEAISKMRNLGLNSAQIDEIMVQLIAGNYINEERFARTFARGKHRIKNWGINRIVSELKARHISSYNITAALKEIDAEDYDAAFNALADCHWQSLTEKHPLKKRKKFCDFLLRKGYDSDMIYAKVKSLEKSDD